MVLCSELPDNPGTPITKAAELIAAQLSWLASLNAPVWIEHRPLDSPDGIQDIFHLVVFEHHEVRETVRWGTRLRETGQPSRKPLDRATVETLVGAAV